MASKAHLEAPEWLRGTRRVAESRALSIPCRCRLHPESAESSHPTQPIGLIKHGAEFGATPNQFSDLHIYPLLRPIRKNCESGSRRRRTGPHGIAPEHQQHPQVDYARSSAARQLDEGIADRDCVQDNEATGLMRLPHGAPSVI